MRKPIWHAVPKLTSTQLLSIIGGAALVVAGTAAIAGDWSGEKSARAGEAIVYSHEENDIIRSTRSAEDRVKDALNASLHGKDIDSLEILKNGETSAERAGRELRERTAAAHAGRTEREIAHEPIREAVKHDHSGHDFGREGHEHQLDADNHDWQHTA